ncbi:MAG: hypothetical protein WCH04_17925 [Gammaproteobacteria bacterium]
MNDDYSSYTCYGFHEHSLPNIREEHVEEGIYDDDNCTERHRGGDEVGAKYLWQTKCLSPGEGENNAQRPDLKW